MPCADTLKVSVNCNWLLFALQDRSLESKVIINNFQPKKKTKFNFKTQPLEKEAESKIQSKSGNYKKLITLHLHPMPSLLVAKIH
jgi:hypothetical protein